MNSEAINRRNRTEVTRLMPVAHFPEPSRVKPSTSVLASLIFLLGATLVVWTTRHNLLETFAAYYLLGMSTLYVVTRRKSDR